MGFGLKIAPGIRVSASSRGIRAGVGPRVARVSVGSGGVGLSTGAGPLTLFTGLGGGSSRTSVSSYERELRRAEREEDIAGVARADQTLGRLMELHREEFPSPSKPEAPGPAAVDERLIRKRVRGQAAAGISPVKVAARAKAKRDASADVAAAIAAADAERTTKYWADQALLDERWARFLANDPELVLPVLEAAFEDNQAPAAAVGCDAKTAYVVMRWPTLGGLVGERKFAYTPSGKPTHHKQSETERNQLYVAAMASSVLATTKEAMAVAPGLDQISLVVVRGERDLAKGGTFLSAICVALIRRKDLVGIDWQSVRPTSALTSLRRCKLLIAGKTHELQRLDVEHDPNFAPGLASVAEGMGWKLRPPVKGGRVGAWARRAAFEWSETADS